VPHFELSTIIENKCTIARPKMQCSCWHAAVYLVVAMKFFPWWLISWNYKIILQLECWQQLHWHDRDACIMA
jgi:hypothetical protein